MYFENYPGVVDEGEGGREEGGRRRGGECDRDRCLLPAIHCPVAHHPPMVPGGGVVPDRYLNTCSIGTVLDRYRAKPDTVSRSPSAWTGGRSL